MSELSAAEKQARQMKMFGCTAEDLDQMIANTIMGDTLMLAMSILSDAQEVLSRGDAELSRQFMNRAKYVISKKQQTEREAERVEPVKETIDLRRNLIRRVKDTIFLPLPKELWQKTAGHRGTCGCPACQRIGTGAYWDTLAISIKAPVGHNDYATLVHYPELHVDAVREEMKY